LGVKTFSSLALLLLSITSPGHSSVEKQQTLPAIIHTASASCATTQPCPASSIAAKSLMIASWYGQKFQGRLTANGEYFDKKKLTAANKVLPLGSIVRLTVPSTGRSVVVRINDRGPWIKGRDFDLSEAAATELGIHKQGIAGLEVAVLSEGPRKF
jgi:rare lipoprotein A (peptidoglycan hydrolase)